MSAGNAVFVEALGLALVPLGDSLPAVRRQLAGKPVRLVSDQGLTCWPSSLSWCRPWPAPRWSMPPVGSC